MGVKCKMERHGYTAENRRAHDSQWGTRILGMYAEGRTGKVTRRATAEHMTAPGGAGLSIGAQGDSASTPRAVQATGKTLLPSPANIRIVTEWYRSGNGKDKEGMKKNCQT